MTLTSLATPQLPRLARLGAACAAVAVLLPTSPALATAAADVTGGAAVSPSPQAEASAIVIRKISCLAGCDSVAAAQPGATLRFQGPLLARGRRVVYLGGKGTDDDVVAQLRMVRKGASKVITALVPKRAQSGPVAIETAKGARSAASKTLVTLPQAVAPVSKIEPLAGEGPFFPIQGKWTLGTGAGAYGASRGGEIHQGQDVFAECGTPLVAAEGGTVVANKFQSRAGNYLVIRVAGADRDEAYMHLRTPALPQVGDTVKAGVQIGEVGETGRADGCHLHFELWLGHWQGVGGAGHVIDPRPSLKSWSAAGTPARR